MLHALGELHVRVLRVLDDVRGLVVRGRHGGLLHDDLFGEVLEELVQLHHRLLDLLDVVVAGADGAQDGGGGGGAVGFELAYLLV